MSHQTQLKDGANFDRRARLPIGQVWDVDRRAKEKILGDLNLVVIDRLYRDKETAAL